MGFLILWFVIAVFCAIAASAKNRSEFGWLILGMLFSILALILIAALPSLPPPPEKKRPLKLEKRSEPAPTKAPQTHALPSDFIFCHYCNFKNRVQNNFCPQCGSQLWSDEPEV
jgi:hypothetical protein